METHVLRRMVIERTTKGQPFATVTYTLVETKTLDDGKFQLEGHLTPPYNVYTHDVEPERRRELLTLWFGPNSGPWFRLPTESRTASHSQGDHPTRTTRMKPARALKGLLGSALWLGLGAAIVDAADAVPPEAGSVRERSAADRPVTPEQLAFFESKIRPVLVTSCYKCHSASSEKIKGGLLLDTREGIRKGGDTGAAVVPGNLEESVLIQAIRFQDDDIQMPPKQKLPDEVIADFERWVAMGAPDPRDGTVTAAAKGIDIEEGRRFWAFQPPRKATPPKIEDEAWPRSETDRYLLAALEAKGLKPVGDADKYTLLRRIWFDLIGLPPTPEEVDTFVKDESPTAFETVVDRLLAAPQFGERWGRHWLDVARFAESSGKQVNFNYPHAWRYRDYVIAAFNTDKPYNRFIKEQIAGDLLPAADLAQRAEQTIATGFLAVGAKSHVEPNPSQFQMDLADEQIDATSQAFLGLTVACARCHDHKFDPIPTRDYYAMAGIFRSTETCYGTIQNRPEQPPRSHARTGRFCSALWHRAAERPAARSVAGPGR